MTKTVSLYQIKWLREFAGYDFVAKPSLLNAVLIHNANAALLPKMEACLQFHKNLVEEHQSACIYREDRKSYGVRGKDYLEHIQMQQFYPSAFLIESCFNIQEDPDENWNIAFIDIH